MASNYKDTLSNRKKTESEKSHANIKTYEKKTIGQKQLNTKVIRAEFTVDNENHYLCKIVGDTLHRITNFIVSVDKVLITDNGRTQFKSYYLKITRLVDSYVSYTTISARDFENKQWIYDKLGLGCIVYAGVYVYEFLQEYISHQVQSAPVEIKYIHVGWRKINGKHYYLHGKGAIGSIDPSLSGREDMILEIIGGMSPLAAYEATMDMLNIASLSVTLPLLSFTLLGLLKYVFEYEDGENKKNSNSNCNVATWKNWYS